MEKRGYLRAGPWTPEATCEYPEGVYNMPRASQRTRPSPQGRAESESEMKAMKGGKVIGLGGSANLRALGRTAATPSAVKLTRAFVGKRINCA